MFVVLGSENTLPARCLDHSFTVHTRYELAPPYPPFVPHISMACCGVAVLNTGDSLIALDIHTVTDLPCHSSDTAAAARDMCDMSRDTDLPCHGSDTAAATRDTCDMSRDTDLPCHGSDMAAAAADTCDMSRDTDLPCHGSDMAAARDTCDMSRDTELPCHGSDTAAAAADTCDMSRDTDLPCHGSDTAAARDTCDMSPDSTEVHVDDNDDVDETVVVSESPVLASQSSTHTTDVSSPSTDLPPAPSDATSATFEFPRLTVPPQLYDSGAGLNIRMYPALHGDMSSSCSTLSTPVILHNETQCFTYSIRRYSSALSSTDVEGSPPRFLCLVV